MKIIYTNSYCDKSLLENEVYNIIQNIVDFTSLQIKITLIFDEEYSTFDFSTFSLNPNLIMFEFLCNLYYFFKHNDISYSDISYYNISVFAK